MKMIFIALILSSVFAQKYALDEWIGANVNWDSKTEPFMAAEMTQIDPKIGPAIFLTKNSKITKTKRLALCDPLKPKKPRNKAFSSKVKTSQQSEKRTIEHLIYVLSHLFQH